MFKFKNKSNLTAAAASGKPAGDFYGNLADQFFQKQAPQVSQKSRDLARSIHSASATNSGQVYPKKRNYEQFKATNRTTSNSSRGDGQ